MVNGLTMLVVDDLEVNRASFRAIFEEEYEILEARDGEEALRILRETQVDVVVLDLFMPVLDGSAVIGQMKADVALRDIPIIVKTALDEESETRMLEMGVDDFIFSPCEPAIIKNRVRNVVQRNVVWQDRWQRKRELEEQREQVRNALLTKEILNLRAPLQEIVALCRAGENGGETGMGTRYGEINRQAICALTMINNFLDVSDENGNEVSVNAKPFQFEGIVADITREYTTACRGKGIHFVIETCEMPFENLCGDSRKVKQIWCNLLEKAYYHTDRGGTIKTAYCQRKIDHKHVELEITVESDCIVGGEYTLTKGLVEVMHGSFTMKNKEDCGSVAEVRLPLEIAGEMQQEPKLFGKMRVLVLDDNEVTSSYHAAIISRLGVSCDIAGNLAEALCFMGDAFDNGNYYDLCLINWYMAGAKEMIAEMKSSKVRGGMRIACSTNEKERMEPRMREAGVDYIVERPVYQSTLYHFFSETFGA